MQPEENFIFRPDITSGLQSKGPSMKLESSQARRLRQGNELAEFVRIKPINEKNVFNDDKVGKILKSDAHSNYVMTRAEKLSLRAEELKQPPKAQPIEVQKPPSQHSSHSKASEKPLQEPAKEVPRATYSKNERQFFGVSSHSSKGAPESRRSEAMSKGSHKERAPAVLQAGHEQEPPKTSYERRTDEFGASQDRMYPRSHDARKH
eukprot:TRINITY_DN10556_c0_g6_i1.p1 TRINITY_DN10556_c0_g6~~TRINITY_DN10556_c0_g6_i1.p1  ORF type:complete len:206 (-),score=44.62 TRINITY_DN10556_c0_g6_i1:35-652(-)